MRVRIKKTTRMTEALKSVSDKTRVAILDLLFQQPGRRGIAIKKLVDKIGIDQTLLSYHLAALKEEDIVQDIRKGREKIYALNKKMVKRNTINFDNFSLTWAS